MINLLPDNEKKQVYQEYRRRRLVVILGCVFFLSISAMVFMAPSYIFSIYKVKEASSESLSVLEKSEEGRVDLKQEIASAQRLTSYLKPETGSLPSETVGIITKNKGESVITLINYDQKNASTTIVTVRGISKSRQELRRFADALESDPAVGKGNVNIPVSNFAKDTDIEFNFSVNFNSQ